MDVTLGMIDSIPAGDGRTFRVGEVHLAVFRSRAGGVFVTQAECPHRGGPLADGLVGGSTVICPLHSLKFDLVTGQSSNGECTLKTYPVRLGSAGQVLVEVGS